MPTSKGNMCDLQIHILLELIKMLDSPNGYFPFSFPFYNLSQESF